MWVDNELVMADSQVVTAAAGSTNVIDLGATGPQRPGRGRPMFIVVILKETMSDSSSNSAMGLTLETDDDVAFGSPTTAVQTLPSIPALSEAGYIVKELLSVNIAGERYLRVKFTPTNGNLTTGKFTAFLTDTPEFWEATEVPEVIES